MNLEETKDRNGTPLKNGDFVRFKPHGGKYYYGRISLIRHSLTSGKTKIYLEYIHDINGLIKEIDDYIYNPKLSEKVTGKPLYGREPLLIKSTHKEVTMEDIRNYSDEELSIRFLNEEHLYDLFSQPHCWDDVKLRADSEFIYTDEQLDDLKETYHHEHYEY